MALRTKTIEFAFPLQTDVDTSGTARDFTQITVYIPEASPTFRSVILENTVYGSGGTQNVTAVLQGIALGLVARNDVTVTQTLTSSGEDLAFIFLRDVTSYFTTNWSGTSMTADCRLTVTGPATINATAKLIITYEYDDFDVKTRIKTVRIPIDGNTGALTTTLANVGGVANQIPALDTFLPETEKVYRDIFFETYVHTGTTGNTDRALNMRFDGTTTISATYEGGATSDYPIKRIDKIIASLNTANSYNIEASTANVDMPFTCLCGILYVTYQYNHETSTSIMNSIQIAAFDDSGWAGGTTTADWSVFSKKLMIPENGSTGGGTLALKQSGLLMSMIDALALNVDLRIGAQPSRVYAHTATQRCGAVYQMRRFDDGASGGAGFTISRGIPQITTKFFTDSTTIGSIGSNVSGVYLLNYISEKHTEGDAVHNHTTYWLNRPYTNVTLAYRHQYTPTIRPTIPEKEYHITCNCYNILLQTVGTAASNFFYSFQAEYTGSTGADGWAEIHSSNYNTDAEIGPSITWVRAGDQFKRHPHDPNLTRMDIEAQRDFKFDISANVCHFQVIQMLTYSSKVYGYSGSFSGADNSNPVYMNTYAQTLDGDGFREITTGSYWATGPTGNFKFPWYYDSANTNDPVVNIIIANSASKYRNVDGYIGIATSSISFDLSGAGSGGPTYYAYT